MWFDTGGAYETLGGKTEEIREGTRRLSLRGNGNLTLDVTSAYTRARAAHDGAVAVDDAAPEPGQPAGTDLHFHRFRCSER